MSQSAKCLVVYLCCAVAALLCPAVSASAQNAGTGQESSSDTVPMAWRALPPAYQALGLSDVQAANVSAVLARYQAQRERLLTAVLASTPQSDATVVRDRAGLLDALRGLTEAERADVGALLTPSQLERLRTLLNGLSDHGGAVLPRG